MNPFAGNYCGYTYTAVGYRYSRLQQNSVIDPLSLSTLRNAINLASSLNGGSSIFLSIPARILNLEGGFFFKGMYKNIITVAAIGK
jgi:hypothetical protein